MSIFRGTSPGWGGRVGRSVTDHSLHAAILRPMLCPTPSGNHPRAGLRAHRGHQGASVAPRGRAAPVTSMHGRPVAAGLDAAGDLAARCRPDRPRTSQACRADTGRFAAAPWRTRAPPRHVRCHHAPRRLRQEACPAGLRREGARDGASCIAGQPLRRVRRPRREGRVAGPGRGTRRSREGSRGFLTGGSRTSLIRRFARQLQLDLRVARAIRDARRVSCARGSHGAQRGTAGLPLEAPIWFNGERDGSAEASSTRAHGGASNRALRVSGPESGMSERSSTE